MLSWQSSLYNPLLTVQQPNMDHKWDVKPSAKNARILSSTFIITGIFCFLLYTWNDYTENNNIFHDDTVDNYTNSNIYTSHCTTATVHQSITHTITPTPTHTYTYTPLEVQQNSIKVQEQISSLRKEIASTTTHTSIISTTTHTTDPFNPMKHLHQILNTSPVVLFLNSKKGSPDELYQNNLLKNFLTVNYEISPTLAIVDLNKHENGGLLQDYIKQYKLNRNDNTNLPYLFINSRSVLDTDLKDHLTQYHHSGELLQRFKNFADGKVSFNKIDLPSNN